LPMPRILSCCLVAIAGCSSAAAPMSGAPDERATRQIVQAAAADGTWSTIVRAPVGLVPTGVMTDGTVLFRGAGSDTTMVWYTLTPDHSGSYENGTWSQVGSSSTYRDSFPSTVLKDGRFWIGGGEQGIDPAGIEIYDPAAGSWSGGRPY